MNKKQWLLGMFSIFFCAVVFFVNPSQTQAAGKADVSAYRAVFDATYYYNANPDVAAAMGNNSNALLSHYINFGINEGRSASAEFNAQAYKDRYPDLQAAFGNDMAAYCRHYVACGKSEGRNASADGQVASVSRNETSTSQAASTSGNVIGSCTTNYQTNIPRENNVVLAAQRINGVVVQPGQSFSFSQTILPRTSANGYVEAPIFVSGNIGRGIGGGVCQVSSTLYAAMIHAGLPATERHPHSRPVDYLPQGFDATIAGNTLDLKFTNTFSQPLQIQASANGGSLTVNLVLQ